VCYADDPRLGVGVLNNPQIVMLRGRAFCGTG
jgi:hypothetical protein